MNSLTVRRVNSFTAQAGRALNRNPAAAAAADARARCRRQDTDPGRIARGAGEFLADSAKSARIHLASDRDDRHRPGGAGVRSAGARSASRSIHPYCRRHGYSADHARDQRRRRAAVALLRLAVRGEFRRRCPGLGGLERHWLAASHGVGGADHAAALRSLRRVWIAALCSAVLGRRRRCRLEHGDCDVGPVRHRGVDRLAAGRTATLRAHHRAVAAIGGDRGDILELAVGPDRSDRIDASDAVSVGRRAPYQGLEFARYPIGRHPGADHAAALLSTRALGGFGRNHRERARISEAQLVCQLLRSGVVAGAASGAAGLGVGCHQQGAANAGPRGDGGGDRRHRRGTPQAVAAPLTILRARQVHRRPVASPAARAGQRALARTAGGAGGIRHRLRELGLHGG